jgi:hypothetical protein
MSIFFFRAALPNGYLLRLCAALLTATVMLAAAVALYGEHRHL